MPMIQYSLRAMLELFETSPELEGAGPERVVELMCHNPADLLGIEDRGYIREGYYADLVIVNPTGGGEKITDGEVISRCGWTPLAGLSLSAQVDLTMVNGTIVYEAGGVPAAGAAMPLKFGAAV